MKYMKESEVESYGANPYAHFHFYSFLVGLTLVTSNPLGE